MFSPCRSTLFVGLVALAAAGCTGTGGPDAPASVGDMVPRPRTLLVNELDFAADLAVVDRELDARLEKKFGGDVTGDVIKSLAARRVNDEIVATVIALLRAVGLNAQPGYRDQPAPKGGAVVVAGEVHAVDQGKRPERGPVGFGTGSTIVAEMTMSQISEGPEKQLLTFTVQAPSGRQSDPLVVGPAADAAITTVIAAKSSPDVSLSPEVAASARGLGRAIADKILAFAAQQGWQLKPALAPAADSRPANKKPENSSVAAVRPVGPPGETNTIPCASFTKNDRGNWYVEGPVTFDLGTAENETLQNREIPPKFYTIGGVDLYTALQKKCGPPTRHGISMPR
ncbi:MAG: hypothetical protein ABSE22_16100 [Xanthobacteraceae bacterium]